MKNKREVSTFSLSFLDVMCCGFGAVVLLVMIINGQTLQRREETHKDLQAELERVTLLREFASDHVDELQAQLEAAGTEERELREQADRTGEELTEKQQAAEREAELAQQGQSELEAMRGEIDALEQAREEEQARGELPDEQPAGERVGFDGEGRRQYLTGLKLGGDRTLILVDASASMLEETIVNAVRLSVMPAATRRRSQKWQRVVRSVHWLVANLPPDKDFQVYFFNTQAIPAVAGTEQRWLSTSDKQRLEATIDSARELAPEGGTNLQLAFDVIKQLDPRPDSVLLLTDGLPTQGRGMPVRNTISEPERRLLFNAAARSLPAGVPINTLLFPMEGDPRAASAFWGLAIDTKGSFITPSRDWP